jgi:hypothetical protein
MTSTLALTRAVAAHGLPGTLTDPPATPLEPNAWRPLVSHVRSQRLSGHLATAVASGAWPATEEQVRETNDLHVTEMCAVLLLENLMLDVVERLESAGVAVRVLKGSAVAHLDYELPFQRSFGDVDLLVQAEQYDTVTATLARLGHQRLFNEPRAGFDRRFGKGTCFRTPDGYELDVHRTFAMGPLGLRVRLDDLWATSSSFRIADRTLQALAPETRFLHACFHLLARSEQRLVPQRDIAEMVLHGRFDFDSALELAERWNAKTVIARAVHTTWATLEIADVTKVSTWAYRYQPSAEESRELAVYARPGHTYAIECLAALRAIPSFRDKVRFIRALALPEASYLAARDGGMVRRMRRAIRELRAARTLS